MKIESVILERSGGTCELCSTNPATSIYEVPPADSRGAEGSIHVCDTCLKEIDKKAELNPENWKALSTAMWSEVPGVQVVAWRMLNRLRNESWAAELLDMMYLDDTNLAWAKATGDHESDGSVDLHKDANGHILENGDSVVLIKSLDVKGSSVNARLGTVVRNIRLDPNNTEYIEGKIDGQTIVILTKYLRKQN